MIHFSKLQFEVELRDDLAPFGFWGTRLRGGYGDVLRKELCSEPDRERCPGCPSFIDRSCDFPYLFKPHSDLLLQPPVGRPLAGSVNLPPPFVIAAPPKVEKELRIGSRLIFDLLMFGPTLDRIARTVDAFFRLGEQGLDVRLDNGTLGKSRFGVLDVRDLLAGGRSLYVRGNLGSPLVVDARNYAQTISRRSLIDEIVIEFVTPVVTFADDCPSLNGATADQNKRVPRGIMDFYQLTRMVVNRIGCLWQMYGSDWPGQADFFRWQNRQLKASKGVAIEELQIEPARHYRYGKSQNRNITVEGFTGALRATGDASDLMELLLLGELFHIGESTAYGLGQYKLIF